MDLKIRACLAMGFLFLICYSSTGQNQKIVDSLELIYEEGNYQEGERLEILYNIAKDHPDPERMLVYSAELLKVARELDSSIYIFRGYLETATGYRLKGDHSEALAYHFKALEVATTANQSKVDLGLVNVAIADDYSEMGDSKNAVTYYRRGIKILRDENNSLTLATALLNFGDEYFNQGELDSALLLFQESAEIFNTLPDKKLPLAYILGNVGLVHAQMGDNNQAESDITRAIQMLEEHGDLYGISVYLTYMSDIYVDKGDTETALNYAHRALDLALQHGLKGQIRDANLKLSELYERIGNLQGSIKHYKDYNAYKD
ncbi:MAG: tetratricopeptide repeat protein, partial [Cyclobacteriaceae bacterium]|nr:tetratricopeptide repeat protein [Cyclobacteriaceae bacterium]